MRVRDLLGKQVSKEKEGSVLTGMVPPEDQGKEVSKNPLTLCLFTFKLPVKGLAASFLS